MKKLFLTAGVLSFLIFIGQTVYSAPSVYLDFDGNAATAETAWAVTLGDTFSADVYASDFTDLLGGDHGGLIGFGLDTTYDNTVLSVDSYAPGASWSTPLFVGESPGNISLGALYLAFPPLPGLSTDVPLLLGTIDFSAIAVGVADILLMDRNVVEFVGLDGFNFEPIITFQGANVAVNAVPVPSSIWLLCIGAV